MRICSVTVDVDCLYSNFKGFGLKKEEYSYREFEIGIENILDFFDRYNIKATFFFVAKDLEVEKNAIFIKEVINRGHEIASHSYSHPQGFRLLSIEEKIYEFKESKKILQDVSGQEIIGFRSPGWNISDDCLPILRRLGYKYDSSVFPASIAWLLKAFHYFKMRRRDRLTRTTLGHLYYTFSPSYPYYADERKIGKKGNSKFIEFPLQVTGCFRLPFFATFHLSYPLYIKKGYDAIKNKDIINYQMHLSDFVDYTGENFKREIPEESGSYLPLSLKMRLVQKMEVWKKIFNMISRDYKFETLKYCTGNFIHYLH